IYILAALVAFTFTANAQYSIDFDSMTFGDAVGQDPNIILWPAAGVTSSQVTDAQSFSGNASMVTRENDGTIVDDVLMKLGNQTSGVWSVSWMMYVPDGSTGFWNIQNADDFTATAEAQWNGQFFIGLTASGGVEGQITFDQDANVSVPYPTDTWFNVTHVVDMDNGTSTLSIDGELLIDGIDYLDTNGAEASQLGAINYYAIDADNLYYVDDFVFAEGNALSTDDFAASNFSVYPNPVQNRLNIQSNEIVDAVVVYDVLGKVVMSATPGVISPSIDMSALSSGAYLVNVTINGASKTVKVIK
ncbi:MAG: T9SS type A sorting domain-containing protein, partial [Marinirhabdus sp.]|nr:T9SS type A sorting domain-containing protein [Marinirhabdus sp.]